MTVSLSVRHVRGGSELDIETSDEDGCDNPAYGDWRLATDWLHRVLRPDTLSFPLTVTADRWEQDVPVDGTPCRFAFVGGDGTWCARGAVGGRQVSMSVTGWSCESFALVAVSPQDVSGELPVRS